jgi:hypothetical protein
MWMRCSCCGWTRGCEQIPDPTGTDENYGEKQRRKRRSVRQFVRTAQGLFLSKGGVMRALLARSDLVRSVVSRSWYAKTPTSPQPSPPAEREFGGGDTFLFLR